MSLELSQQTLRAEPRSWLITGVAGFIGSNLLEALLRLEQRVVGLDNFATGYRRNLDEVRKLVTPEQWARFEFIEGDICDIETTQRACRGVEYVLHQAALGSVPRSLADPVRSNLTNVNGFLHMLVAARDAGVQRFVYAASSSTYGDHPALPKVEGAIGNPLSPYAVTKYVNELYASVFTRSYGLQCIGLRYFNVFGPRQDPHGAYAAVIPKWLAAMLQGAAVTIHGDGQTSRDFCFVANAVQANLLAATGDAAAVAGAVYNVAVGEQTSLNELFELLRAEVQAARPELRIEPPLHSDFRQGDVRHSLADIARAARLLGYAPTHHIAEGIRRAMPWYLRLFGAVAQSPLGSSTR